MVCRLFKSNIISQTSSRSLKVTQKFSYGTLILPCKFIIIDLVICLTLKHTSFHILVFSAISPDAPPMPRQNSQRVSAPLLSRCPGLPSLGFQRWVPEQPRLLGRGWGQRGREPETLWWNKVGRRPCRETKSAAGTRGYSRGSAHHSFIIKSTHSFQDVHWEEWFLSQKKDLPQEWLYR